MFDFLNKYIEVIFLFKILKEFPNDSR